MRSSSPAACRRRLGRLHRHPGPISNLAAMEKPPWTPTTYPRQSASPPELSR